MAICASCGTNNVDSTKFCVQCGGALSPAPSAAPPPESWRYSGDLNQPQTEQQQRPRPQDFTPPPAQPPAYPAYTPTQQGMYQPGGTVDWQALGADKKIAAGICGIVLGGLGVHKFVLGYTVEGLILLLATVLTCGLGAMVTSIIGIVEGIIYLTKSDAEFVQTYVQNKRGWF